MRDENIKLCWRESTDGRPKILQPRCWIVHNDDISRPAPAGGELKREFFGLLERHTMFRRLPVRKKRKWPAPLVSMRFLSDSRAHNEVFRCATRAYASRCSTVQSPFNVMQATVSRILAPSTGPNIGYAHRLSRQLIPGHL